MRNYVKGGGGINRVGTDEFIDLCHRVNARPFFFCVNFLGERRSAEPRAPVTRRGGRRGALFQI